MVGKELLNCVLTKMAWLSASLLVNGKKEHYGMNENKTK